MKLSRIPAILGSALLSVIMLGSMTVGAASEDEEIVKLSENVSASAAVENVDEYPTNDELLLDYLKSGLTIKEDVSDWQLGKENLNSTEYAVYKEFLDGTKLIADGLWENTVVKSSKTIVWSYDELGVSVSSTNQEFSDAVNARFIDMYIYLLSDGSYNLYWHDKTIGFIWQADQLYSNNVNKTVTAVSPCFIFTPAIDYAGSGAYTVNINKTKAAKAAADNTAVIVSTNASKSDYKKLEAYKNKICELVEYDFENVDKAPSTVGINTWQLIQVFDNDPSTKVVCEGYSKAFHYLCQLSTFKGNVKCCTVMGSMYAGTGGGLHMWNNVQIDGKNYIVDVTNCDEGMIGSPDLLFLKGMKGSVESGYVKNCYGTDVIFVYNKDYIELFGEEILTLSSTDYVETAAKAPALPSFTVTAGNAKAVLKWNAVSGATKYRVFYRLNGASSWTKVDTTSTSYTVNNLKNGKKYNFLVLASNGTAWSEWTNADIKNATPKAPASGIGAPVVTATPGDGEVYLTWAPVSGATKYRVYQYYNGKFAALGDVSSTNVLITDCINGIKIGFLVRAYGNGTWSSYTNADIVYATPTAAAPSKPVVKATAGDGRVVLQWNAVSGATKYRVYYYLNGKYTLVGNTAKTAINVTGLKNGVKYGFLVRAYVNGTWTSYTTADLVYATPKGAAKPVVKATAGDGRVVLQWNAVSGATKYRVYYYVGGKYTLVGNTAKTAINVTGLKNGTKYGFLVRAYVNGAWTSYTSADLVYATPKGAAKPSVVLVSGNGQVKVSWSAVTGATKYRVYYYVNGKYTVACTTTGRNVTVGGLKNGVEYGFLVRAYINGEWTAYTLADLVYATPEA